MMQESAATVRLQRLRQDFMEQNVMPSEGPSLLSLSAAGFYIIVFMACLIAAGAALRLRQPPRHWRTWAGIALVFAVLACMRVADIEEALREALRAILQMEGTYEERRSLQRPLAAAAIAVVSGAAAFMVFVQFRAVQGRRDIALLIAVASAMIMALLLALRIISLHQVDALLYGPLKLNWVADIGASCLVLGAALYYVLLVRKRP